LRQVFDHLTADGHVDEVLEGSLVRGSGGRHGCAYVVEDVCGWKTRRRLIGEFDRG